MPPHSSHSINGNVTHLTFSTAEYAQCGADLLLMRNANRATPRDKAYFEWRYAMRPNRSQPIIVFAANNAGKKIGCLSLIPHDYMLDGKTRPVGVLGDISVESEWRGRGVTQAMIGYVTGQKAFHDLAGGIVLPNESAARALHKAHWETISKLERYVKIIDIKEKLSQRQKPNWLLNRICGWLNGVMRMISLETYVKKPQGFVGEVVSDFDERFDLLWNNLNKQGMNIGCRNREYLTWRYSKHPLVAYQIYALTRRNELCGYIVFHVTDRQCSIDDILCMTETPCARYLLSSFLNFIRNNSLAFSIDLKTNNNDLLRLPLRLFGFIKRPGYLEFMLAKTETKDPPASFTNGSKWYLTSNDKDV